MKLKYNWNPTNITIDYSLAEKKAINYVFPNCNIVPYFFHFVVNLTKHLKEIKSKNITIKNIAKDCLSNIKLLSFIPINDFDIFYRLILKKYRTKSSDFFKYFNKY